MAASEFPLFSRLAPELRYQIWQLAMPEMGTNVIYFYRPGIWRFGALEESETGANERRPGYEADNVVIKFYCNLLDDIRLEVPLAFVNHEARSIALPFIQAHRLQTRIVDGSYYPIFVRPMNLDTDALYIGPATWPSFSGEPWDTWILEPGAADRTFYFVSPLRRLAVHQSLLQKLGSLFPAEMMYSFVKTRELLIVAHNNDNGFADLSFNNIKSNNWWEICQIEPQAFVWNEGTAQVDYEGGTFKADSDVHKLIIKTFIDLHDDSDTSELDGFECRPVLAVQASS